MFNVLDFFTTVLRILKCLNLLFPHSSFFPLGTAPRRQWREDRTKDEDGFGGYSCNPIKDVVPKDLLAMNGRLCSLAQKFSAQGLSFL